MSPRLFGSSGIRGIANIDITPFLAQRVGAALATMHPGGTVVVGRDTRVTGEMLETALTAGMASGGVDALLVGVAPTPVVAWMIGETGSQAGVVISASHNPPEYNGLKVFNGLYPFYQLFKFHRYLRVFYLSGCDGDRLFARGEVSGHGFFV